MNKIKKDKTKKKIYFAYLHLKKATPSIKVKELVSCAKIKRSTFYLHFHNINEVPLEIDKTVSSLFVELEQEFRQVDLLDFPDRILYKLNEIVSLHADFLRLYLEANNNYALIDKIKTSITQTISNNFRLMRYVTDINRFKIVVQYIVGGVLDAYTEWLYNRINCSLDNLKDMLLKLVKFGLLKAVIL